MNKEIVILGKSPFINEVSEELPVLLSLIECIGINGVIGTYPQITHCCFIDSRTILAVVPYWKDQTLITTKNVGKMIRAMGYKQPNLATYGIERNKIFTTIEHSENLGYSSYSFTMALSWCLRQGYKTVYLCGIDFYNEVGYYNDMNYKNSKPCTHSEKVHFSKEFLWRMAGLINIVDLNPKCYSNLFINQYHN